MSPRLRRSELVHREAAWRCRCPRSSSGRSGQRCLGPRRWRWAWVEWRARRSRWRNLREGRPREKPTRTRTGSRSRPHLRSGMRSHPVRLPALPGWCSPGRPRTRRSRRLPAPRDRRRSGLLGVVGSPNPSTRRPRPFARPPAPRRQDVAGSRRAWDRPASHSSRSSSRKRDRPVFSCVLIVFSLTPRTAAVSRTE